MKKLIVALPATLLALSLRSAETSIDYEVEYLEADGAVYVDTGFVCNRENWDYRLDAALTRDAAWGGANCRLEFLANEGRGRRCQFRVTCFGDRRDFYLNGVNQDMSASFGDKQTGHAILVLNYGRGAKPGTPKLSQSGRVYGFELYRNDQLVQRLLPAVDTNGVACFLDDVTGKLFHGIGKGKFTAGPRLGKNGRAKFVPAQEKVDPPAVVDVDCGRQLFVDDWLIASMEGVNRHWNAPTKVEDPILRPTDEKDGRLASCTVATDGGLWWDPVIRKYRLWYETNWCGDLRYAESADGLKWEFPDLGVVKGTNRLFEKCSVDSFSVFPDYAAENPYGCWNLFVSAEGCVSQSDTLYTSSDGRRFRELGVVGFSGDRSTMYYDPFRARWIYSLRDSWKGRSRRYADASVFAPKHQSPQERWTEIPSGNLYSFAAVPYESLMLGVMELLGDIPWKKHGREDNAGCADAGLPKQTSLQFSFSRDGRAYAQGGESCRISPSGWGSGKWDTGYLSAIGGVCVIRDERLWFYYSALRGDARRSTDAGVPDGNDNGMYYNGSIGAATLRRDGFAGLVADGEGTVLTRPLRFGGGHLFVNAECLFGDVAAEIVDAQGKPVPGYALEDCEALAFADTTKRELKFRGGSLAALGDRRVAVRFRLRCATLYSFWISPSERGESRGYVAAGGPAYKGLKDL